MDKDEKSLSIPHRKKQKANRSQLLGIVDEDLTLLSESVAKVAEKYLGNLTSMQTKWIASITTKFNRLENTVAKVHDTIQDETYGVDPKGTLATPVMLLPLRIEMPMQEFSIEEADKEVSVHSLDTLIFRFL